MRETRLLVVGSTNIDLITRVARVPKPGETLFGSSFTTVLVGKGEKPGGGGVCGAPRLMRFRPNGKKEEYSWNH